MLSISRICAAAALSMALVLGGRLPVSAATPPAAPAAALGSVSGTITDAGGAPLPGVTVTLRGATVATATTGADGTFVISGLAPGLYTVTAAKSGYGSASQTDVAVVAGAPQVLTISLVAATLSSLREIGRTSVNVGRNGSFNASPASVAVVTSQVFVDQSQPQVARILQQTPGVVSSLPGGVNNASPGAITFPDIRGALSFETAALIDGHPLSVGQYGDYVTTFLNSFVLQSVELIKGPGASSPTISRAIGGTVNFRTLDPTTKPHGTATIGLDSFGGAFSNFGYSNTVGKFGFLLDYAVNGTPGPLRNAKYQMPLDQSIYYVSDSHGNRVDIPNGTVDSAHPPGQYNTRGEAASSLVFCCQTLNTTFTNKNELVKLKYAFSGATTLTASYLGSQTYADQNGNNSNRTTTMFTPGAGYTGSVRPGTQTIVDPDNFGLPAYEMNNEPIFGAEIRTSLGNDTILARYYAASISRLQYGSNHDLNASSSFSALVYGGGNGNPVFNGLDQYGKPYVLTVPGPNDPVLGASGDCVGGNGPNGCGLGGGNSYYDSAEEDRLAGTSFEYDHFLGNTGNVVSFAYDNNHARTHSYQLSSSLDSVPAGSTQDTTTYLLRGIFTFGKLNVTASNYLTDFRSHYGIYLNAFSSAQSLAFQNQDLWHYDGRLGLVLRPTPDASLRFSLGSAVAPPYLGALVASTYAPRLCGGFFTPCPPGGNTNVAVSQAANPGLQAETSFGYNLGGDLRLKDRVTLITADLYLTNLHNQLIRSTFINGTASVNTGEGTSTLPLYTTAYTNVSNARYAGLEFGVRADRPSGFGYTVQGALLRAYPYNLSPSFYTGSGGPNSVNLGVVPQINFGSHQTVSNQAIPYSQGYGELRYTTKGKIFASFGETYYGPNNSLGEPAFFVANATIRAPLGRSSGTSLQISADNLFNAYSDPITNEYTGLRQPLVDGRYYAGNANVIGPRNVRISITHMFGSR